MALEQEISKNRINLLILPGERFNEKVYDIVKKLSKKHKICFISVNKGYHALLGSFKKRKINPKNFFFIDCITETLLSSEKSSNCKYVSSPKALTELSLALNSPILNNYDIIIVDSLSTLSIYHTPSALAQFVNSVSQRIKNTEKTIGVLLISSSDTDKEVFSKNETLVDKVIHVK